LLRTVPAAQHARKRRKVQGNPERPPGIEGVEMRKVYYNLMRFSLTPVLAVSIFSFAAVTLSRPLPTPHPAPQQATLKAASLESHEGLTISALPWTDPGQYKEKFPKKSPYAAGVLAVQVVFRNDTNESLRVNLDRIRLTVQLEEENRQEVAPLTSQQLADAVTRPIAKDPTARRKLPIPTTGGGGGGRDKHWTEVQRQAQDAEIPSSVVAAHGTVQGLLYFDLQNQFDLLQSAHLYIPQISQMEGSRALTYFDIDLSRSGSH
jgi:hypothetical protein